MMELMKTHKELHTRQQMKNGKDHQKGPTITITKDGTRPKANEPGKT